MKPHIPGITLGQHRPHDADERGLRLVVFAGTGGHGSWNGIERWWTQLAWLTPELVESALTYDPARVRLIAREDEHRLSLTFMTGSDGNPHPFTPLLRATADDGLRSLA